MPIPAEPYEAALAARTETLATLAVHAGEAMDPTTRALDPPLVLSSAFGFADADDAARAFRAESDAFIYGRWANPTARALETKLAALEGAEDCCVTASGMAAVAGAVMSVCASGDHVVAPQAMYGESARLLRERLTRFGVRATFVDASDPGAYAAAVTPETRVLYIETPANPTLRITDIAPVVALARERGLVTIADNTFATPYGQNPLALGVDLVVHSMTKAIAGHGDAIGGAIAGARARVEAARDLVVKGLGGVLSPFVAYMVLRGLRTFPLRQERACATAAHLAARLAAQPSVARVHHPSLPAHPGHGVARAQMHAYGSVLAFELADGAGRSAIDRGKDVLGRVRVATHAVSLGDVRTLVVHPASTTHSTMPRAGREAAGITDGLIRVSVGLEGRGDLERDLLTAIL